MSLRYWLPILIIIFCYTSVVHADFEIESPNSETSIEYLPGVALAEGVSQITGVAISPLWGVTAVGAWRYYQTAEEDRDHLPWYSQPYLWGSFLGLLLLTLSKDVLAFVLPAILKKPFDYLELIEDKVSALVVSTAFVPLVAKSMAEFQFNDSTAAMISMNQLGFAALPVAEWWSYYGVRFLVLLPLSLILFGAVWLLSHTVNVMIALSPFSFIDATLKIMKGTILLFIGGLAVLHPLLPLLLCIPIAVIALTVSGWTLRNMIFGSVFSWQLLFHFKTRRTLHDIGACKVFLARSLQGMPIRTYGILQRDAKLLWHFTPLILGWIPSLSKSVSVQVDGIERGVLFSSFYTKSQLNGQSVTQFILPPKYRFHTAEIALIYDLQEQRDSSIYGGMKAARNYIRAFIKGTMQDPQHN